jgi:hypothetical protein
MIKEQTVNGFQRQGMEMNASRNYTAELSKRAADCETDTANIL